MCKCALCTVDDSCCFHDIRLGPKTSVCEKHVSVMSIVTSSDVTNYATTLQGFNKQKVKRKKKKNEILKIWKNQQRFEILKVVKVAS